MSEILIQTANQTDIRFIQALAQACFAQRFAASEAKARDRYLARVFSDAALQRALYSTGSNYLLARLQGTVIGLIQFGSPLLEDCEDRKEIYRLLVHPHQWRQGIGSALLNACLQMLAKQPGVHQVFAYAGPQDAAHYEFYRQYGFQHHAENDKDADRYMVKIL